MKLICSNLPKNLRQASKQATNKTSFELNQLQKKINLQK